MFQVRQILTKENLLNKISSYQIFKYYCNNFINVEHVFKSEFRNDENPSCYISYINGDLLYKDFGENMSYRCIDYVSRKYQLKFFDTLNKINNDFNLGLGYSHNTNNNKISIPNKSKIKFTEKKRAVILKKKRDWNEADKKYWLDYNISLTLLEEYNIDAISHYWINSNKFDNKMFIAKKLTYSYNYYWHNDIFLRKIYMPQNKPGNKFISNVDNTIVQGIKNIPFNGGDELIITSSFKDLLTLKSVGINAIAPNNEGSFIPEIVFEKLKIKWKKIIIWYDNDFNKMEGENEGVNNAKKFSLKYQIPWIITPDNTEKDPSDFIKTYGVKEFNNLINFLK